MNNVRDFLCVSISRGELNHKIVEICYICQQRQELVDIYDSTYRKVPVVVKIDFGLQGYKVKISQI